MHASKPYVAYYKEILDYIGKEPNNCVMIGDMWEDDIVPATSIGIYGYWFTESDVKPPQDIEFLIVLSFYPPNGENWFQPVYHNLI